MYRLWRYWSDYIRRRRGSAPVAIASGSAAHLVARCLEPYIESPFGPSVHLIYVHVCVSPFGPSVHPMLVWRYSGRRPHLELVWRYSGRQMASNQTPFSTRDTRPHPYNDFIRISRLSLYHVFLHHCKIPPSIQRMGHVETVAEWFRTAAPEQGTVARVVTELDDAAYRPCAVAILIFDP